jgi:hypothetical protein
MRRFILLAAILLAFTACGGPKNDPLNPPDAPVIPPGRSKDAPPAPPAPAGSGVPAIPAR